MAPELFHVFVSTHGCCIVKASLKGFYVLVVGGSLLGRFFLRPRGAGTWDGREALAVHRRLVGNY